ncbi:MAG: hypothetical protein ABEJ42_01125 [Halobacteriaceae archaeon]
MVVRLLVAGLLRTINRVQSLVEVRTAEAAVVFLSLGGFYALAILGIFDPNGVGPIEVLFESVPLVYIVGLTVGAPTAYILLEWLAALDDLRRQPGYDRWSLDQRTYVLLEINNEIRDRATVVYVPLAPIAAFWTLTLMTRGNPLFVFTGAALVVDIVLLVAINRFMHYRDPARLPPGTMLGT